MEWWLLLIILFVALLLLMLFGLPIAFSLGGLALAGFLIWWPTGLDLIALTAWQVGSNWVLVAIPLFLFMAEVIGVSGFSAGLFDAIQKWTNRIPGALAVAGVGMSTVFAATSGSSAASAATIGSVAIPEMMKRGYDKALSFGSLAAGGAQAILIPPSIALILYGSLANVSVGDLFIAGVVPGLILSTLFAIYIVIRCIHNPSLAPKLPEVTWGERLASTWKIWGAAVLILLVLGTIYGGVATPTEAAGIGAFGATVLALIYKTSLSHFRTAILRAVRTTSMILFIFIGGMLFSKLLVALGLHQQISDFVGGLTVSRWVVMSGIYLLLLFLGCIVDPGSLVLIFTPLLVAIITPLGFDPLWFGIIFIILMEAANLTPPVGYNLFVLKGIAPPDVTMGDIIRGSLPFVGLMMVGIILISAFPQIATWLPNTMK